MQQILFRQLVVGPFQCNCRIWVCRNTGDALVVDPGDEASEIIAALKNLEKEIGKPVHPKMLLQTHGHLDHIAATREVKTKWPKASGLQSEPVIKIALHRDDQTLYDQLKMQGSLFGLQFEDPLPIDHYLEHEEKLKVGDLKFTIIHTPGHSPGSVCVRLHEDSTLGIRETLLTGDTLFQGSVGRTDLWGASADQMFKSIRTRILTLDGDTCVCPGHGEDSTLAIEKRENPFLK